VRWVIRPPGEAERGAAPAADVWLARVEPSRPAAIEPPLPSAAPESLAIGPAEPPRLEVDEDLKPPIQRRAAPLHVPARARAASVELDVRVDEQGRVSDAMWAGGSADSALVRAATECALAMEFFPALQGGRPVAVWCRQRFDFGRR
jgi:TonB family protein